MTTCSIVIPVHNRAGLTRECLDTLLGQGLPPDTEIVVVDDASSDDTSRVLASYGPRIRVAALAENRGFASACNEGVARAEGRYVVLLNNDTRPTPGWLQALIAHAEAHPEAALVGSRLLWPAGTVQHAGVGIDGNKDVRHIYMGFPGDPRLPPGVGEPGIRDGDRPGQPRAVPQPLGGPHPPGRHRLLRRGRADQARLRLAVGGGDGVSPARLRQGRHRGQRG